MLCLMKLDARQSLSIARPAILLAACQLLLISQFFITPGSMHRMK